MPHTRPGDKQVVVSAFLINDNSPKQVLLHHHKKFNAWMPLGGHQEQHENSFEALIREAQEEAGIDIRPFFPELFQVEDGVFRLPIPDYIQEERISVIKDQPTHYHQDLIYVVRIPHQEAVANNEESHDIKWFTLEETEKLAMLHNVRKLIEEIFNT